MTDNNRGNRPLSPHLQIYRPQMSSVSSILNRLTGISLLFGFVLMAWWVLAASIGVEYFDCVNAFLSSTIGSIVLIGSLWALCYHALGGIRHLIWDIGYGFDIKISDRLGWIVIIGSFLLTAVVVYIAKVCI